MTHDLLEDPFLVQKLNPLLLETLKGYWSALKNANVSEEEKIEIREALYNLIRFAFRHLFQPLYLKYVPKVKGSLFLLSAVHSDGIGDFIATLNCARLLKEHYPEIDVHVAYTHKQKLPHIDPAFYHLKKENIHSFAETEDPSSLILGNVLEGKNEFSFAHDLEKLKQDKQKIMLEYEPLKENHPEAASAVKELADNLDKSINEKQYFLHKKKEAEVLYAKMKECLALIHIALALNTFDNPALAAKSLYFAETGNFQGLANYLQRNWFSMGLDPFEEGIFLQKQKEPAEWKNIKLSRYLWKTEQPSSEQIGQYLKQNTLQMGYIPHVPEQKQIFIELIGRRYVNDDRHIDIILPKQEGEDFPHFEKEWMVALGISKIIATECYPDIKERVLMQIDLPAEKILRLIYALPLPHSDFIKLIDLSGEIVGCTGDGSFSDCIIAGKIPFYEVRHHKLTTIKAFRHLARILSLPDVMEYFEQLELFSDWPAASFIGKFEKILNDGAFKLQWKVWVEFIRRCYCFEDSFIANVNRHLLSHEVKEKEELLIQSYFEKTISAEDAYQTMEKILKNRTE